MRRERKSYPIAGLKAIDTETGTFEAIVSVFGNVDLHGHRIAPDAFDASLERWVASGDPIPVIFSHQWDDLSAYLGTADPGDVRALAPGDPDLPDEVAELGGLYVKGTLDTEEPEGRKAAKLLKSRAIREFSFAYDIIDEAKGDDGFLDLLELDLIETGPTLKGANPMTQLIGAKAAGDRAKFDEAFARVAEVLGSTPDELASVAAFAGATPAQTKAFVTLTGTLERLQEAITREAVAWASDTYGDNLYTVWLEGTYTDRVVVYVELWDDPVNGGRYFEASYEVTDDVVTLGEPVPVDLVATAQPKSRPPHQVKAGARNASADLARIQGIHDLTSDLGAECAAEDPDGEGTEEPEDALSRAKTATPAILRTTLDTELLEID